MNVGVVGNPAYGDLAEVLGRLVSITTRHDLSLYAESDLADLWPNSAPAKLEPATHLDLLLTFGGDGTLLRGAREARGLCLKDLSASLRIRQSYLQAIERGRFELLPNGPYAVGFVRSYAKYVELDSTTLGALLKSIATYFAYERMSNQSASLRDSLKAYAKDHGVAV